MIIFYALIKSWATSWNIVRKILISKKKWKKQFDLKIRTAKILALNSGDTDKFDFLETGRILLLVASRIIEQKGFKRAKGKSSKSSKSKARLSHYITSKLVKAKYLVYTG